VLAWRVRSSYCATALAAQKKPSVLTIDAWEANTQQLEERIKTESKSGNKQWLKQRQPRNEFFPYI